MAQITENVNRAIETIDNAYSTNYPDNNEQLITPEKARTTGHVSSTELGKCIVDAHTQTVDMRWYQGLGIQYDDEEMTDVITGNQGDSTGLLVVKLPNNTHFEFMTTHISDGGVYPYGPKYTTYVPEVGDFVYGNAYYQTDGYSAAYQVNGDQEDMFYGSTSNGYSSNEYIIVRVDIGDSVELRVGNDWIYETESFVAPADPDGKVQEWTLENFDSSIDYTNQTNTIVEQLLYRIEELEQRVNNP